MVFFVNRHIIDYPLLSASKKNVNPYYTAAAPTSIIKLLRKLNNLSQFQLNKNHVKILIFVLFNFLV
jgi:hypothetical protein